MSRTALAVASVLLFLSSSSSPPSAQRVPRTAADSLGAIVEPLFARSQYDSILSLLPAVIRRAEATHDSVLLGRAITQRGRIALMRGQDAGADLDIGIRIAEATRDTVGLMPAVHFKGYVYRYRKDRAAALRCFERRLQLAELVRSPTDEAWARSSIAFEQYLDNEHDLARTNFLRSIALARGAKIRTLEITSLIGLGRTYSAQGNDREAMRCYKRAWVVSRETGDRINEMWAANNMSVLEGASGDLGRAEQYLRHAFQLARELEHPAGMVVCATNMATRAEELGDFDGAESLLLETRVICETQNAAEYLGSVDFQLAYLQMERGRYRAAAAGFRRLIASPGALSLQHRDFAVLGLAQSLAAEDSVDAAIALTSAHFVGSKDRLYPASISRANLAMASFYDEAGDVATALVCAHRARDAARSAGHRSVVIAALFRESVCQRKLGEWQAATTTFYAALDSLESYRGTITGAQWRETVGQEMADDVVDAGRVLLEYPPSSPDRDRRFFDAMQRMKTRTLLDRITEPRFGTEAVEDRWSNRVATLDDLQAVLLPGEVVLDFHVGSEQSFLAAVSVDSLRVVTLPGPSSSLAERVQLFRSILASPDSRLREQYPADRTAVMQRALARDILGAVADRVAASTRVFVVPDGYFASIPFGTLILDGEDVLMANREIAQVPSASVLVRERSLRGSACVSHPNLVAIGSPEAQLRGARDEVRELARRYGTSDALVDIDGVDSFRDATDACDVLHIAAHALVVDHSPWKSGIRLGNAARAIDAPVAEAERSDSSDILPAADSLIVARTFHGDSYIRAWQIAQLTLPAKLAVLSACETAGGRVTSGEGTLGITAAFLSAGVPVVVSSLWAVDDRVSADIMRAFYRRLARREPVAAALRGAQIEIARKKRTAHPFYWAGFTVVGDGSMVVEIDERPRRPNPALVGVVALLGLAGAAFALRRRRIPSPVG